MNGLQFFVHEDPDAVRIEVAGSLRGADAESVYRAWKRAALPDILKPVAVDITFVTDADEYGRALLVVMHRYGAQIIAQSPDSAAIAQPILAEPVENSESKPGWLRRFITFLREDRPASAQAEGPLCAHNRGAALPAQAEIISPPSAQRRHGRIEYSGLGDSRLTERALR